MDSPWFILQVASGKEVALVQRFRIPAHIPHRRFDRFNRRLRRNTTWYKPAFPGYVFVPTSVDVTMLAKNVKDVYGYLREADGSRSELSPRGFKVLREIEAHLMSPPLPMPDVENAEKDMFLSLCLGATVKMTSGTLAGKLATVGRVKEETVLVRLMGAKHPIEVPKKGLEVVAV